MPRDDCVFFFFERALGAPISHFATKKAKPPNRACTDENSSRQRQQKSTPRLSLWYKTVRPQFLLERQRPHNTATSNKTYSTYSTNQEPTRNSSLGHGAARFQNHRDICVGSIYVSSRWRPTAHIYSRMQGSNGQSQEKAVSSCCDIVSRSRVSN